MRDLRRRNLHRTTGRSPRSCYRRLGGSSSSSASSSPTLPWSNAEGSSPSFSPNRVKEGQSQISPSSDSLFNVSPISPIIPNREKEMAKTDGRLLPDVIG